MRRRAARCVRRLALVLALGLVPLGSVAAEDAGERLEALRRAIEARRAQVAAFQRAERGLLETLETLDRTAEQVRREEALARAAVERARRAAADLDRTAAELAERRERTREALAARAVALYKTGALAPVQLIFSARDPHDLVSRTRVLRTLIEHDRSLLARYREQGEELEALRAGRSRALVARDRAAERAAARQQALREERAARARVLASVRGDRARERRALAELETAAQALEETLGSLGGGGRPRPQGPSFESLRGALPRPVDAPVVRAFGRVVDAEFRTQTFRKGVDFGAPAGAPVRAVAGGRVRYAGWFRGYGKLAIVDHGGGWFTVSGHLADLQVEAGDTVGAGQTLGTVGDTGSLVGPRLYFEVRRGRTPQDPEAWFGGAGSLAPRGTGR